MSIKKRICDVCGKNFIGCDIEKRKDKLEMHRTIDVPCLTSEEKTTWWVHVQINHNHPNQEICKSCAVRLVKIAIRKLVKEDIDDERD
ncbi:hypothetical protein KAR91_16535 [Candidatus Pacearchaeota archaeon]|nr:hypothetical protein [Candidatus Pacearchaeota archaeon]